MKSGLASVKDFVYEFIVDQKFDRLPVFISKKELSDPDPKLYGEVQYDDDDDKPLQIVINPHRGGMMAFIDTVVHECIHVLYEDMPELEVRDLTKRVVARLSIKEKEAIFKATAEVATWRL